MPIRFGIRARHCRDALPRAPIDRSVIAPSLLTADARQWLNADQAEVY